MRIAGASPIGALLIGVCLVGEASAQTPLSSLGSCKGQEPGRFTIRDARLEDPFWILRWRKPDAALRGAIDALKGQPYTFETVNAVSRQIEAKTWIPDRPNQLVTVQYSDIGLTNCVDQQLDVVFRIFSAAPSLGTVFESRSKDRMADETAGLARTRAAWQVAPEAGFDPAIRLSAGGSAQATWSNSRFPFGALAVKGLASTESHVASASLAGEYESLTSWLQRASWQVRVDDSSVPAGNVHLGDRSIAAQFYGTSRPMNGIVTRFGGILNGGRLRSGFGPTDLPAHTVADSDFTASKMFAGVTARAHQQSFAASYAVVLGATGGGFHGDWRKHVGDVAHELWRPVGDHRLLEVEQRLTLGRLQSIGAVPVTERFFGGASDQSLLLGNDWRLPMNPRIRSIPTNRFALSGSGGASFVAYNSTTAFTVWGKPAVPKELLNEPGFDNAVRQALTGARSTLDAVYRSSDPSFQQIKAGLPDIVAKLKRVESLEAAARSSRALPDTAVKPCEEALRASRKAADRAAAESAARAYGWVKELLPDGDNSLSDVVSACGVDLVAAIKGAGGDAGDLASASNDVKAASSTIETRFAAIDNDKWARRAKGDMAYSEHALDVILKQLNITSLSPVFLFDAAHLGPTGDDPHGGNRYAVGGGIRLSLAGTVNMTLTYAVNPQRRAGEGSGAVVFSLTVRNLFD